MFISLILHHLRFFFCVKMLLSSCNQKKNLFASIVRGGTCCYFQVIDTSSLWRWRDLQEGKNKLKSDSVSKKNFNFEHRPRNKFPRYQQWAIQVFFMYSSRCNTQSKINNCFLMFSSSLSFIRTGVTYSRALLWLCSTRRKKKRARI